jgi:hypothetical protein
MDAVAFVLAVPVCAIGAGLFIGRFIAHRDWHERSFHACGYHTRFHIGKSPCERCGEVDDNWKTQIARATLIGWEFKK